MKNEYSDGVWECVVTILALLAIAFTTLVILALTGCSHLSQVTSAEAHQTTAMLRVRHTSARVEKDQKAQMSEIANLATQERIVLSLPETDQTDKVLFTLADNTLSIAGAPSENETRLQGEVKSLLAGGEIQQKEITRLDKLVDNLKKTDDTDRAAAVKAQSSLTTTTTKLYQVATAGAESADFSSSIFKWILIALALLAAWVIARMLLKIGVNSSQAAATVAAKAP